VIAQHLDPVLPSRLGTILARHSTLPVRTVPERTPLEPGVVFVVPSNRDVEITDHEVHNGWCAHLDALEDGHRPADGSRAATTGRSRRWGGRRGWEAVYRPRDALTLKCLSEYRQTSPCERLRAILRGFRISC